MRNFVKFVGLLASLGFMGVTNAQVPQARERIVTINGVPKKLTSKLVRIKKVLVPEFFFNYDHNVGRAEVDRLLNIIAQTDSLQFTFVSDVNNFDPATFNQYAVIVANNITSMGGTGLNTARRTGIQNYVKGGGGIMLIHGSGDTRTAASWTWYNDTLVPAVYSGEAVVGQTARVYQPASNSALTTALAADQPTHPIMESIPRDTLMAEEYHNYTYLVTSRPVSANADVLFLVDNASYPGGSSATPTPHPLAWTFKIGLGTTVFVGIGHNTQATTTWGKPSPTDPRGPYWQRFLKQSLYWAAGYDTTTVSAIRGKPQDYVFQKGGVAFNDRTMSVLFTSPGNHTLLLTDIRGKVYMRQMSRVPKEHTVDKKRLPAGVYILRAMTTTGVQSRRFVVSGR